MFRLMGAVWPGVCKHSNMGTNGQILLQNRFHVLQNTDENEMHNIQGLQESRVTPTEKRTKVTTKQMLAPRISESKNDPNVLDRKFDSKILWQIS